MDNVVFPTSVKDQYNPNDIVDYVLSFENKRVLQGSIRIEGKLHILKNNAVPGTGDISDDLNYDPLLGIHGAFQGITTSCDRTGTLDNMATDYPRHVKASRLASVDRMEFAANSQFLPELTCNDRRITRYLLNGSPESRYVTPFSFKPRIAFNDSSSDISYAKTGNCRISLRLSTNEQFLQGNNVVTAYTYYLSDLRIRYQSQMDDPKLHSQSLVFSTHHIVKSSITSNNVTISTRIPAVCRSVVMMFMQESEINNSGSNNWGMEEPPNLEYLEFAWNDSTQQYVTYRIDDVSSMLYNYLKVYSDPVQYSSLNIEQLQENSEGFAAGFKFNPTDLTNQKFSININSGIDSNVKFTSFLLFNAISVI